MAGFVHADNHHGQLVINSVSFMTPMSRIMNLQVLHSRGTRGSSVVIPAMSGSKSRRRRRAERVFQLEMLIDGRYDSSGVVASNPYSQLDTNMAYFDNAVIPPTGNTGHTAVWTLRTGSTKSASVFIEEWEVEPHDSGAPANRVTFQLAVPDGRFGSGV